MDLNEVMGALTGFEHLSLVQSEAATSGEPRAFTVAELEAEYRAEIRALRQRARMRVVTRTELPPRVRRLSAVESRR